MFHFIIKYSAIIIGIVAFGYYSSLSSKTFTWLFASGDSGDWLAASNWWMVPQPFGSPLYISLGHLLDLFPGDLVVKMTLLLSALPAAITVVLVYLIVKHLTDREWTAITSSVALLGATVFLSQATILEEYAIATMFVALAFFFYIKDKKKLTVLSLGLGTAVHIMVAPIAFLWLLVHIREWKQWAKVMPVYILSGIAPYGLILWLMASDTPRLVAGGLSWGAINSYLGSTSVVGSLSIVEAPERLMYLGMFLIVSFAFALVPAVYSFKKPWDSKTRVMLVTIAFSLWYYATCFDPTTWTFMIYSMPFLAIAVGVGLSKLKPYHTKIALAGAVLLILANGLWLNADRLNKEYPVAPDHYRFVQSIPDGSAVITYRGGWEALGLFYAMSEGKDLIPIFIHYGDADDDLYLFYLEWLREKYGLEGYNAESLIQSALDKGIAVRNIVDR